MSNKNSLAPCWEMLDEDSIKLVMPLKVSTDLKIEWFQVWEIYHSKTSNLNYNKLILLHQTPPSSVMLLQVISHRSGTEPLFWATKASQSATIQSSKTESMFQEMLQSAITSLSDPTVFCKEPISKIEPSLRWVLLSDTLQLKRVDL